VSPSGKGNNQESAFDFIRLKPFAVALRILDHADSLISHI